MHKLRLNALVNTVLYCIINSLQINYIVKSKSVQHELKRTVTLALYSWSQLYSKCHMGKSCQNDKLFSTLNAHKMANFDRTEFVDPR